MAKHAGFCSQLHQQRMRWQQQNVQCYLVLHGHADIEEVLESLPELTRLNVNGCISLSRLVLKACTKLEWLDCSGCAHLHNISTLSSALSHMTAVACQRLVVGFI